MRVLIALGGAMRSATVAIPLALILIGGCGNDDPVSTASNRAQTYPKGPTREFIVPGGDNAVQLYGHEATVSEREAASRVIHDWMRARAAADWVRDCRYLSRSYVKELVADAASVSNGEATTCASALEYFGPAASGDLKNNLDGPIDSLRVGKTHSYAQYHGREGTDWIIPMHKENGRWRVAIAAPIHRER